MANYKLGKVYTCLNTKEAEKYIGKKGFFSDSYRNILDDKNIEDKGLINCLFKIQDTQYPFKTITDHQYQFFRPFLEERPTRMTEEEIIEWCARGNGLATCYPSDIRKGDRILWGSEFSSWETDLKKEVGENVRIRHFGTDEILIPTREIFLKDCRNK